MLDRAFRILSKLSHRPTPILRHALPQKAIRLLPLEPRMLFDGSVGADITGDTFVTNEATIAREVRQETIRESGLAQRHSDTGEKSAPALLVIDPAVGDWEPLVENLASDIEVLVLDVDRDGLSQIADRLAQGGPVSALHLVSHGSAGRLQLGDTVLQSNSLEAFAQPLGRIASGLTADADIAASSTNTGSAQLGGDWFLERAVGQIDTEVFIAESGIQGFDGLLAPTPELDVASPGRVLIGESFTISAVFDNTALGEVGYAPYIDIFVPSQGVDGGATPDGVTISDASYLGLPLARTEITLTAQDIAAGTVAHPYFRDAAGSDQVSIEPGFGVGDQLIVYELPFGSFIAGQPAAPLEITGQVSTFSDVGVPLNITARAGFRYGQDALDNPTVDPSVQGLATAVAVTPEVLRLTTTYIGDENETASGLNYSRAYRIDVDIAEGQTVSNLALSSALADAMQFTPISGAPASIGGFGFGVSPGAGWINVNGVLVSAPAPGTGASGNWNPLDSRDKLATIAQNDVASHSLTVRALAFQKDRSILNNVGIAQVSPGDTLAYSLALQVSDYFAVGGDATPAEGLGSRDLLVTDTLSDGLEVLDTTTAPVGAAPSLIIERADGSTEVYSLVRGTNYTVAMLADGRQQIEFNLRSTVTGVVGLVLVGDLFDTDNTVNRATTAALSFQARVLDSRLDPDASGLMGEVDTSRIGDRIDSSAVVFAITARNGVPATSSVSDPLRVVSSDEVTYRIAYTVPTGDFEDFQLNAYLPLPIFDADNPTAAGVSVRWNASAAFSETPSAGFYSFRATGGDGAGLIAPALTVDGGSNSLVFDFGDRIDNADTPLQIEVFFTVAGSAAPFSDGLFFSAQAEQAGQNTASQAFSTQATDRLLAGKPDVSIYKGAVQDDVLSATSRFDPSYSPVSSTGLIKAAGDTDINPLTGTIDATTAVLLDTDIGNVDAGDTVRFAIVLTNVGGADAFDVHFRDELPANIDAASVSNLRLVKGDGIVLNRTVDFLAADGLILADEAASISALFGSGLQIVDATGRPRNGGLKGGVNLSGAPVAAGSNVIIVTYDAQVIDAVVAGSVAAGNVTLFEFSGLEGGPNYATTPQVEGVTVTSPLPVLTKHVLGTSYAGTLDDNGAAIGLGDVVVGEVIQYRVVLEVPEGVTTNARFIDTLDAGQLSFVSLDSYTASRAGITFDSGNVFTTLTPSDAGTDGVSNQVQFELGTITNTNRDNSVGDTITLIYSAVVTNQARVQQEAQLNNQAQLNHSGTTQAVAAPTMRVIEPLVTISNTADATQADAGDTVRYTLTLTASAGVAAHEVSLSDSVPTGMTYVPGSLVQTGGPASVSLSHTASAISGFWSQLESGQLVTLTFEATIDTSVAIGSTLDHRATVAWSSLPGDVTDVSPLVGSGDVERTGVDGVGSALNNYASSTAAPVTVDSLSPVLTRLGSSESTSLADQVVPGELVRYRMIVALPESVANDFQFEARLPAGLRYFNDGVTTIGLIADGAATGIDSDILTGQSATPVAGDPSLDLLGGGVNAAAVSSIAPVLALPDAQISDALTGNTIPAGVALASGSNPRFSLGRLTNSDRDTNREFVVIEFTAIAENETGNNVGSPLVASFVARSGAVNLDTSNTATLTVQEPAIVNLDKRVVLFSGNQVTFEVSFSNSGSQTAHNVSLLHSFAGASNISFNGAGAVGVLPTGFINNSTADSLDLTAVSLAPSALISVRYTATVTDTALPVLARDTSVTYTSLSLAGEKLILAVEDSAGVSASVVTNTSSERTGNTSDYGGLVNTYRDTDAAGLGVISGVVWDDTLANNRLIDNSPLENRLAGVNVNLLSLGADGVAGGGDDLNFSAASADGVTAPAGQFSFGALPAGRYQLGAPGAVSDVQSGPVIIAFDRGVAGPIIDGIIDLTLAEGQDRPNNDFSYVKVNAAPLISAPATQLLAEDVAWVFTGTNAIRIADPDQSEGFNPAASASDYRVWLSAGRGSLTASAVGTAVLTGNGTSDVTVTGSLADVNATLSGLSYLGNLNANGTDSIKVRVDDNGTFGDADNDRVPGEAVDDNLFANATIALTVIPVPDRLVANPDERTIVEPVNASAAIATTGNVIAAPFFSELADTDVDGDTLTIVGVAPGVADGPLNSGTGVPLSATWGVLTLLADGSYRYVPGLQADGIALGEQVTDSFSYTASDGIFTENTTLTIRINGQNDGIAANPDRNRASGNGQATTTLSITVDGLNEPPAGVDRTFTVSEDLIAENGIPLRFRAADFGFTDPDTGDLFQAVGIGALPVSGSFLFDGRLLQLNEVVSVTDISRLTYRPAQNANNVLLPVLPFIEFVVIDSSGLADPQVNRFTIDISPIGDPPVAPVLNYTVGIETRRGSSEANIPAFAAPFDPDVLPEALIIKISQLPPPNSGQFELDGLPVDSGQLLSQADLQNLAFIPNPAINASVNLDGTLRAGSLLFTVDDGSGRIVTGAINMSVRPIVQSIPVTRGITGSDGFPELRLTPLPDVYSGALSGQIDWPAAGPFYQASDYLFDRRLPQAQEIEKYQEQERLSVTKEPVTASLGKDCKPSSEVKIKPNIIKRGVFAEQFSPDTKSFTEQIKVQRPPVKPRKLARIC